MSFQNDVILKIQSLKYLMKIDIDQLLQQGITAHKEGKLEEAKRLYMNILKINPLQLDANYNMGIILISLNKSADALPFFKTAIKINPNFTKAYFNSGIILNELGKLDEAETSYKKAIEIKPDYAEAYNNLAIALKILGKLEEAETNYKKAIELKPDYVEAHKNLGNTLNELGRLDEAEASYRKAIEIKPDYIEAHNNLDIVSKRIQLLSSILQAKKIDMKKKVTFFNKIFAKVFNFYSSRNNPNSNERLSKNPLILNRSVEKELLVTLYKMNCGELDKTKKGDARYGNVVCSDFKLFENGSPILKTVAEDLIRIMSKSVKSDIYIMDSFFNIIRKGGGTTPHSHVSNFDKIRELDKKKFSLTYYLTVGDQNCTEPGILKLYNPMEEILPSEGTIVIIPAGRNHSAVYDGEKDRVMIGVNFYSLL